jgi:hypothetical protein
MRRDLSTVRVFDSRYEKKKREQQHIACADFIDAHSSPSIFFRKLETNFRDLLLEKIVQKET